MGRPLDQLTIEGFKSIRSLKDFPLGKLNVLIGANGAGKSNFVQFFRMIRSMADGVLNTFCQDNGGADGLVFCGPKLTPILVGKLTMRGNGWEFALKPLPNGKFLFDKEEIFFTGTGKKTIRGGGSFESSLGHWRHDKSKQWPDSPGIGSHVYDAVSSWTVYHFHDTSSTAQFRREGSIRDFRVFNSEGGNLAAFLYHVRESNPDCYQRIRETLQMVAPFFDDFLLEPVKKGSDEMIRLEWRQRGSTFPFQPWHFSDGTLRFLCLATALLQPKPPSTILIDEPELGLHPFALDILGQLIREASTRTQIIVSTQSPTLLSGFDPKDVIVVDRVDGASRFQRLDAAALAGWLEEYTLGDLLQKNVIEAGPAYA